MRETLTQYPHLRATRLFEMVCRKRLVSSLVVGRPATLERPAPAIKTVSFITEFYLRENGTLGDFDRKSAMPLQAQMETGPRRLDSFNNRSSDCHRTMAVGAVDCTQAFRLLSPSHQVRRVWAL